MTKLLAIALSALALAACSSAPMSNNNTAAMGAPAEIKNSTDSNRSGNRSSVSPGGAGAGASGGDGSAGR